MTTSTAKKHIDESSSSSDLIKNNSNNAFYKSDSSSTTSTSMQFPRFENSSNIHAQTIKMAGRINAAFITDEEHQRLIEERAKLLDKKFAETITKKELSKLEYVRWSLDRIEDAKYGGTLDSIEESVSRYENFLEEIHKFEAQLRSSTPSKKRK